MDLVLQSSPLPGVVELTLNRPDKRNALSVDLMEALCASVDAASQDDAVRIIVLRGAGAVFCAGLDLSEVSDPKKKHISAELVARCLEVLYYSPKITVARVHGAAIAGGAGLMSTCDFAYASDSCKFGYPETRRGLVAGLVMTFLRRQLRERDARELLLSSELIDSKRAHEIGLVNRVYPEADLEEGCLKLYHTLLKTAPKATAATKEFFETLWTPSVREDIKAALAYHMEARNSPEAVEGARAFLEKREPAWAQ